MKTENEYYRVELNARGAIAGLYDKVGKLELISEPRLAESWRLSLPLPYPGLANLQSNYLLSAEQAPPTARKTEDGLEIRWEGPLVSEHGSYNLSVTAVIRLAGPELSTRMIVENRSGLTLAEVWVGGLGGLRGVGNRPDTDTISPGYQEGYGGSLFKEFPAGLGGGTGKNIRYPEWYNDYPGMSMSWFSMWNAKLGRGLYYGMHDEVPRCKFVHAEMHANLARLRPGGNWPSDDELRQLREPAGVVLHWVHFPYLASGKTFRSGPVVVQAHNGDWHAAAKIYRQWFAGKFPLRPNTENWLRREQVVQYIMFMLAEGDVLHTFKDIPALAREAAKFGVKTIMIAGWWTGGHDNGFPDYSPDPRVGTWEELRKAIAACHRIGVRVLSFANIDTVDASTKWYRDDLHKYAVVRGNGLYREFGYGYGTLSARMGQTVVPLRSCDAAFDAYRKIIVDQMRRIAEVGIDGVHLDKVNCMSLDFHPDLPGGVDTAMFEATLKCIKEILQECRKAVPDFAVSVETSWDRLLTYVDGWWTWINKVDHLAPFKYAFGEFNQQFTIQTGHDFAAVNAALCYGYHILFGGMNFSTSIEDPAMRPVARYLKEAVRIRGQLADTIFLGEFLDDQQAAVTPRPHLRYGVHRNLTTGKRACVLANYGPKSLQTSVKFDDNKRGSAAIYRPFEKVIHAKLPAKLLVHGECFAVVVEE
jgi:hypothetical protein